MKMVVISIDLGPEGSQVIQYFCENSDLQVITLETEVFHPQISLKEKRVDLTRYFPDGWKRDKHHVWNALIVLHR